MRKILSMLLIILLSFTLVSCQSITGLLEDDSLVDQDPTNLVDEEAYYTSKEDVSFYIHSFGKLPNNFITKKEAMKLGWDSSKGNLWDVTDKKSIGGDRFGNREGRLPKSKNRQYYECDIDYDGGYRGAKRIVYSDDGLVYFTEDHYDNFTLLYGDE